MRAVADGHRRVAARALLHHERGHRLADDVAPADDDARARPSSRRRERISISCTPDGVHGAKAVVSPMTQLADVHRDGSRPRPSAGRCGAATEFASMCFGSGICTRIPWIAGSAFSRSMVARSSSCVVVGGQPDRPPMHARLLARLPLAPHVDRARGIVADEHHGEPGRDPRRASRATSCADLLRGWRGPWRRRRECVRSAGKVHRPGFPDHDDLDLAGILQLGLDPARDLLGELDVMRASSTCVGRHDHADLAAGLDRERPSPRPCSSTAISSSLRAASRTSRTPRAARRGAIRRSRRRPARAPTLALVRHVVVVRGDAVDHERSSRRTSWPPRRRAARACPRARGSAPCRRRAAARRAWPSRRRGPSSAAMIAGEPAPLPSSAGGCSARSSCATASGR